MDLKHLVRSVALGLPRLFTGGVPKERAGDERLASRIVRIKYSPTTLISPAFEDGARIPVEFTSDGGGGSPPLRWDVLPPGTRSLALIVEDPDAPTPNPFVHWLVYGIPIGASTPEEALSQGAKVGRNSMMRPEWAPCAPPRGDMPHRYFFQLFALDTMLSLGGTAGRSALLDAIKGHVLGGSQLIGTYSRAQ